MLMYCCSRVMLNDDALYIAVVITFVAWCNNLDQTKQMVVDYNLVQYDVMN